MYMDNVKLKKIDKMFGVGAFISVGLCALIVLLTWLYGVGAYSKYVNGLPEDKKLGNAFAMIIIIVLWIASSIALGLDFVAQLILGIRCVSAKKTERTRKRAVAIAALCVLDGVGLAAALWIALTLKFMKFQVFLLLAVLLALDIVYKIAVAIYVLINKKKLYSAV